MSCDDVVEGPTDMGVIDNNELSSIEPFTFDPKAREYTDPSGEIRIVKQQCCGNWAVLHKRRKVYSSMTWDKCMVYAQSLAKMEKHVKRRRATVKSDSQSDQPR